MRAAEVSKGRYINGPLVADVLDSLEVPSGTRVRSQLRFALVVLARHCNADGECWPSAETIARQMGVGRRQAQKSIEQLVGLGYVLKVPAKRAAGGLFGPNHYRVNCAPRVTHDAPSAHRCEADDRHGVKRTTPPCEEHDARTSQEDIQEKNGDPPSGLVEDDRPAGPPPAEVKRGIEELFGRSTTP